MKKPTVLMILDGYGIRDTESGNAVKQASTPVLDRIFASYPGTTLGASGLDVGLPQGQMGNSEVGHTNIGAGRIVYQDLTRITKAIDDGDFFSNPVLASAMDNALEHDSALHIMGLLSDGGVHSHTKHLLALLEMADRKGLKKVYVHAFLDGRDVPPRCAEKYIGQVEAFMQETGLGKIATVSGRFYAMDRDNRYERLVLAYDALTRGQGKTAATAAEAVTRAYSRDESDEFVLPTIVTDPAGGATAVISDYDSVIMYNFRPDRAREITRALVDDDFSGFLRQVRPSNLKYICMTQYDATIPGVQVAFPPQSLANTIGEYVSAKGLSQLRIAETEKYAHVTFFFNGGVEAPYEGERRVLIPSPKVETYDLQPEMSAVPVTDALLAELDKGDLDLVIINYANCDMVGHTGVMEAAVKAVEAVDSCVGRVVEKVLAMDGRILLTADHGNADEMLDLQGNVVTSHSLSPVPLVYISEKSRLAGEKASADSGPSELMEAGVLADIAPTLLTIMGLEIPSEMTGHSLLK